MRRRASAAIPKHPTMMPGRPAPTTGTGTRNNAALCAVVTSSVWLAPVNRSPRSQHPTHDWATENCNGDAPPPGVGNSGMATLSNPVSTVNPVAPGSNCWVEGRNAPIGLGGDPFANDVIPRNSSKPRFEPASHWPLACVNVTLNGFPPTVPIAVAEVSVTLLGTNSLNKKLVPSWAGDANTLTFKKPFGAGVKV